MMSPSSGRGATVWSLGALIARYSVFDRPVQAFPVLREIADLPGTGRISAFTQ